MANTTYNSSNWTNSSAPKPAPKRQNKKYTAMDWAGKAPVQPAAAAPAPKPKNKTYTASDWTGGVKMNTPPPPSKGLPAAASAPSAPSGLSVSASTPRAAPKTTSKPAGKAAPKSAPKGRKMEGSDLASFLGLSGDSAVAKRLKARAAQRKMSKG